MVDDRAISPEYGSFPNPLPVSRARTLDILDSYNIATATVMPANRDSTIMSDNLILASPGINGLPQAYRPKTSSPTVSTFSHDAPAKKINTCKPVVQASGITGHVELTEPYIILTGFEHDGRPRQTENSLAIIRGALKLQITKPVKIRKVYLKLTGICQTEWPEGIPPFKTEFVQRESQGNKNFPYFDAKFDSCQTGYGDQCKFTPRGQTPPSSSTNISVLGGLTGASTSQLSLATPRSRGSTMMLPTQAKRLSGLSLNSVNSRSFQKGDSPNGASPAQKGYAVFHPGTYEYPIEIGIDHTSAETMTLPLGFVRWEIEVYIERAGTFKNNLVGAREVTVIRAPEQNSLEQTEPISINKTWDDQLHYEVIVSGKTFAIGSTIPMAFKLTPLAKIRVHRIRVYTTEHVDYFTTDKKVARKDIKRKLLLFEKTAGKPVDPRFSDSRLRFTNGGETPRGECNEGEEPNLVGDLTRGEQYWGATEMELDVKLPTCSQMEKDRTKRINPDSTYKAIVVRHWLQITIRVSRPDPEDPEGKKRRQFEISIDSPYHIIHCKASSVYTSLPAYSQDLRVSGAQLHTCGCPDAAVVGNADDAVLRVPEPPQSNQNGASQIMLPAVPAQAHFSSSAANGVQRPIHLLRSPSFDPPPFDADMAPPLVTPPPDYDMIVGTPSHDGLADYFARLSAEESQGHSSPEAEDQHDENALVTRSGAVNVATPGGRIVSRSMDIQRPPFTLRPQTFDGRII